MKIVFKSIELVKMYGEEITYDKMVAFVKNNFPLIEDFNLTFQDDDGDAVTLANQMDVDVMKEMNEGKEIVRVDIIGSQTQKSVSQRGIAKGQNANGLSDKQCSERIHSNSNDKKCHPLQDMFSKTDEFFNYQVSKIVEEKIYSLMPCFVNQVQTAMNDGLPKVSSSEDVIHKQVFCSGCSMAPIMGIRYKCLKCHQFNLCQTCEQKIMHEHNLLKMRKPMENEEEKDFPCRFGRCTRRRKPEHKRKSQCRKKQQQSSSSNSSSFFQGGSPQGRKSRERKHANHKWSHRDTPNNSLPRSNHEERLKSSSPSTDPIRLGKITKKMADKFGGSPDLYKEYVGNRMNMRYCDILKQYCTDNNLEMKCNKKKNLEESKNTKLRKLCLYFNKEEKEFIEIVNEFPELKFDDLLVKLQERGTFDFDPSDKNQMKKMKTKLRKQTEHSQNWMKNSKLHIEETFGKMKEEKPLEVEPEINNMSLEEDGNIFRFDPKDVREKGRILDEMIEIFGKEKTKQLYRFIERNFSLGQQKMIEKWMDTEFEKNKN